MGRKWEVKHPWPLRRSRLPWESVPWMQGPRTRAQGGKMCPYIPFVGTALLLQLSPQVDRDHARLVLEVLHQGFPDFVRGSFALNLHKKRVGYGCCNLLFDYSLTKLPDTELFHPLFQPLLIILRQFFHR